MTGIQRCSTSTLAVSSPTDTELPAYGINEDRRFPVVDNMLLLYYGIPESRRRVDTLVSKIEASEKHLALAGQMVEPPYPDGFISRASTLFDGGRYHNGDVWTWFSNRYVTALYRLGYSERAERHLRAQARAAVRDGGFSEYYEDDAEGAAKGNFHYSPTAATFQLAMVEGLFGVRWDAPSETLFVHPSVRQSSRLHLRLGGQPVTVRIDLADDSKSICIEIDAKRRARGEFRVLLPEVPGDGWRVFQRTSGERKLVSASILDLGKNRYLVFKAVLPPGREVFDLVNE